MHQQPGDRNCANEAIGGAHHGPVIIYMSKVSDATTNDGRLVIRPSELLIHILGYILFLS